MNKFKITNDLKSIPIIGNKIHHTTEIDSIDYLVLDNIYFILETPLKNIQETITIKDFNLSYDGVSFNKIPDLEIDFCKLPCKLFNAPASTKMIPAPSKNFTNLLGQIKSSIKEIHSALTNNALSKVDYFYKLTDIAKELNAAININFSDDSSEECLTQDLTEDIYEIFDTLIVILSSLANSTADYRALLSQISLNYYSAADLLEDLFNTVDDILSLSNFIENEAGFTLPAEAADYSTTITDTGQAIRNNINQINKQLSRNYNSLPVPFYQSQPAQPSVAAIPVSGISFNLSRFTTVPGEIKSLKAELTPSNVTNTGIIYSSSDKNTATVDQNGVITAKNNGSTVITAKTIDGGFTTTCAITVNDQLLTFNSGAISNYDETSNVDIFLIPDKIGNIKVSSISAQTFKDAVNLTSIIIPDSVTSLGNYAFYNCTSLSNLSLPNSVTSIGDGAFFDCRNLSNISISNSVTSIGNYAFYSCANLSNISIPNFVTSIGDDAFSYCANLRNISLPNSVTSIGNRVFANCTSLSNISIPNSVTSIGDDVFSYCANLSNISLPNSVTSIGDSVFSYCTNLSNISIPNSVTSIGNAVFYNCTNLSNISIPNSVTSIPIYAFFECTKLSNISIPNSVTSIGNRVFANCTSLSNISIPNSVTYIGDSVFSYCTNLSNILIPNSVTSIGNYAFYSCANLSNISIPNSVTSIGNYAFYSCANLSNISIPNSVTSIGKRVFANCTSLSNI